MCVTYDSADDQARVDEKEREKPKDQGEEVAEVNLTTKNEEPRPIFMSANLSVELKQATLILFREFKDVFAWT